jgi:hypothetical protein
MRIAGSTPGAQEAGTCLGSQPERAKSGQYRRKTIDGRHSAPGLKTRCRTDAPPGASLAFFAAAFSAATRFGPPRSVGVRILFFAVDFLAVTGNSPFVPWFSQCIWGPATLLHEIDLSPRCLRVETTRRASNHIPTTRLQYGQMGRGGAVLAGRFVSPLQRDGTAAD